MLEMKFLQIKFQNDLNPVKIGSYITVRNSHTAWRETVTVTEIFVVSKEEPYQSLHYRK